MSPNPKELALRIIEALPDDASMGDVLYALYFRYHVDQGIRDADAGNTISHEELLEEIAGWSLSAGPQGRDATSV